MKMRRKLNVTKAVAWLLAVAISVSMLPLHSCPVYAQTMSKNYRKNYKITGDGAKDMVAVARAQAGMKKAQLGYTENWCADFVSDCAKLAGLSKYIPFNSNCGNLREAVLKAGGTLVSRPQAGDIVMYFCKSCNRYVHTALMISSTLSIQGNYEGMVKDNVKPTAYSHCSGHSVAAGIVSVSYIRPAYQPAAPAKEPFCFSVDSMAPEGTIFYSPLDSWGYGGWALSTYGNGVVTCVNLCINGKDVRNSNREERPDVANLHGGNYNCANAGFRGTISGDMLVPGENIISLRAYATSKNENDILIGDFCTTKVYYQPESNLEACLDRVEGLHGGIRFVGWGYNKNNHQENSSIHVYWETKDGLVLVGGITADKERSDLQQALGVSGNHGFDGALPVDCTGENVFHFYVVSASGAENKYLGSRTVTIQENKRPIGIIDSVTGGTDTAKFIGWICDPDTPNEAINMHVYEGGPAGSGRLIANVQADKLREDVAQSEGVGKFHGFCEEIKLDGGEKTLYFYAIDSQGVQNTFLGSRTVNVKQGSSPIGAIDSIIGIKGGLSVAGWTLDWDDLLKPVSLHLYVGGAAGSSGAHAYVINADEERKDVEEAVEGAPKNTGFFDQIETTERGLQEVYVYAIDQGSNQPNVLLGHGTVMIEEPDEQEEQHVHAYSEEVTRSASCLEEGEKAFTCSCGSVYTEVIEKLPHDLVTDNPQEADCLTDGLTEGSHCTKCGEVIKAQETIPKKGHENTIVKYSKRPTCVCPGYTGDTFCKSCGQLVSDGEVIKQLDHTMDKGTVLKAATAEEPGITIFTCTVCESMGVKIIPALGAENLKESAGHDHSYTTEEVIEPATYQEAGNKVYACACGEYLQETIPAVSFQEKYPVGEEETPKEDMEKTTINYELSGGTNHKANPESYEGGKVVLQSPSRRGCVFKGWYLDRRFNEKITTLSSSGISGSSITLYAKWSKITLKKPSVKKIKITGKKAKVTLNKTSGAEGYAVQYSTDKKFKKGVKTIHAAKSSITLIKLKKGSLYLRVRAYKRDSAKNRVYSSCSKTVKIKIRL